MEENTKSSQSVILWLLVLISLGFSSYALFSKQSDVPALSAAESVPVAAVQSQKDLYLERAHNTLFVEGVIVSKTGDSIEMDGVLLDIGKIEGASKSSFLVESLLMKKVRLAVSITKDTYFPFKTLDELEVGEKVIVVSDKPIVEGHPVVATHFYNDVPGL